jgi:hypothetical protein
LFSVDKLAKYPIMKDFEKAIHYDSDYGPCFGSGCNLGINGNSNSNTRSFVYPNYNYEIPCAANGKSILTDGNQYFQVSQIEVYSV